MKPLCSVLLAGALACITSGRAAADPINITGGSLDMTPSSGPLMLFGDRGLTLLSHVDDIGGLFTPTNCNGDPARCAPGATLGLSAVFSDNDLTGTATLDGVSYDHLGSLSSLASASVRFAGSIVLPPLATSATVTAPFLFSGTFFHPIGSSSALIAETLTAHGFATLSLTPNRAFSSAWHLDRAVYRFTADAAATPEPGPLFLTGVGLIALAVALSRRNAARRRGHKPRAL